MSKAYSQKTFWLGGDFIECWTTDTRSGFCHHATYHKSGEGDIATKRIGYINRTWERFQYESTLQGLAEKLGKTERLMVEALVNKTAKEEREKCEKWLDTFSALCNKLDDKQKSQVAKAVGHIDSEEKANAAMLMVATMAVA